MRKDHGPPRVTPTRDFFQACRSCSTDWAIVKVGGVARTEQVMFGARGTFLNVVIVAQDQLTIPPSPDQHRFLPPKWTTWTYRRGRIIAISCPENFDIAPVHHPASWLQRSFGILRRPSQMVKPNHQDQSPDRTGERHHSCLVVRNILRRKKARRESTSSS